MATIIDALVVTLGLDPSKFQKGQKDAQNALNKTKEQSNKVAKDMEADGKQAAQFFSKLRNEAIAFTAALVGASSAKSFIATMVTGDAALGRFAKNVGMSAESLSAWGQIAERSGGTSEGMGGAFKNIAMQMEKLHQVGFNDLLPFFGRLNINAAKFNDESTTMEERALMLADAFHALTPERAQSIGQQMGFDEGTINVWRLGRQELEKLRIEQEKLGHATKENVQAAQDLEKAWKKLGQSATNAGRKTYPVLTESANGLAGLVDLVANGEFGNVGKNPPPKDGQPNWFRGILPDSWIDYLTTGEAPQPGRRKMSGRVVGESGRGPRGIRNNNPGNLNFVGQSGASLESGPNARFAAFGSMPEGVAALVHQLQLYKSRGIDSIQDIIKLYAPSNENNTGAYIRALSKQMGVAPGQHLALDDVSTLRNLITGISMIENGPGRLGIGDINAGIAMSMNRGGSSPTTVHIDRIEINTKATDAKGIAKDIRPALRLAMQADTGLN